MSNTVRTQEHILKALRIRVLFVSEAAATHVESTSQSWKNFILILHISSSLNKAQLMGEKSHQDVKWRLLNTWRLEHECHMSIS